MTTARLVFPAIRWGDRGPDEVWPDVRRDIDLGVGGFVIFGGSVAAMRELAERVRQHTDRTLLFASDLERGAGQQLRGATPLPPPAALAAMPANMLVEAARITAREAAAAGVGWVLAPVADLDIEPANPIVGTRAFGARAASVSERVRTWIQAAQAEGVSACAKHFPGHGRTTVDSHAELPVVGATREKLEADLAPFRAAIEAGVRSVMMAHIAFPELDPTGAPASLSPATIELLREELGFDGVVVTDAFIMQAVSGSGRTEEDAAIEAVRAGCDVVLYPSSPKSTIAELESAVASGRLDRRRIEEATDRIGELATSSKTSLGSTLTTSSGVRALELAVRSVHLIRGSLPLAGPGQNVRLRVLDDDVVDLPPSVGAPGSALSDRGRFASALQDRSVTLGSEAAGSDIDIVAVFSDVKGWKGRSGLGEATVETLRGMLEGSPDAALVLFGHPRMADQLRFAPNVLCAWCGDTLMQEAVAERLVTAAGR
jgi:beta-glucosidase